MPDDSDKKETHPFFRFNKWVTAIVGLLAILGGAIVGLWRIHDLVRDIEETKAGLEDLQADFRRQSEIQNEIVINLRVAVAALQAASGGPRPPNHGADAGSPSGDLVIPVRGVEEILQDLPPLPREPRYDAADPSRMWADRAEVALTRVRILEDEL